MSTNEVTNTKKSLCWKIICIPIPMVSFYIYVRYSELANNVWFICGSTFINMMALFWVFPQLIPLLYTQPIYYENIELMQRRTQRYKLQNYFCIFIGISNSLFVTMTSYYIFRYHPVFEKSYIEIIGIFGGIGAIYFKTQTYFGKFILYVLFKYKTVYNLDTMSVEMFPGFWDDVGAGNAFTHNNQLIRNSPTRPTQGQLQR